MKRGVNKVINRWLLAIVVVFMLAIIMHVLPAEAKQEGVWTYTVYDGEATITACDTTASGEIVIPETLSGYPVTTIRAYAFNGCTELTGIGFSSSVTSIGNYAFFRCSGLTSISIPEGVTSVGEYAFSRCTSLTSVSIPSSLIEISPYMFTECTSLTKISIPDGVKSIGEYAFNGCTSLKSIDIPPSVTSFGMYSAEGCTALTEVNITDLAAWCQNNFNWGKENPCYYAKRLVLNGEEITELSIPEGLTSIGENVFYNCKGIKTVNIPSSLKNVGGGAFYGCSNIDEVNITDLSAWCQIDFGSPEGNPCCYAEKLALNGKEITELVVPEGVVRIGECAFAHCTFLTSVSIPSSVTSIGSQAFYYCANLPEISISPNIKAIGGHAFMGCNGMTEVNIMDLEAWFDIQFYDSYANPCCNAKEMKLNGETITELIVPEGVTSIGDYVFYNYEGLTGVTIPEGVTTIGRSAFDSCYSLKYVNIPSSVKSISVEAFYGSNGLEEVNITDLEAWLDIKFNGGHANPCRYSKEMKLNGETITELVVPNGVTHINDYAFYGYQGITSVTFPESVISIGEQAFYQCSGLSSVNMVSGLKSIGGWAFYECENLLWLRLPASVEEVECDAFTGCDIVIGIKNPAIMDDYFSFEDDYPSLVLEPISISVNTLPNKLEYYVGESFSSGGMVLLEEYYNGEEKLVTNGYKIRGFDSSKPGMCTVTVEHYGETTSFDVTILGEQELEDDKSQFSISRVTLQLENDISVIFKSNAENIDGIYTDVYVVVVQELEQGQTKTETIEGVLSEDGLYYEFKYTGVNAKEVGDLLDVTIYGYKDGNCIKGNILEDYSVMQYCIYQLGQTTSDLGLSETKTAALKTLLVDLVNYASEAQMYFGYKTDSLVSSQLTEEQKMYASADSVIEGVSNIINSKYETVDEPTIKWNSASLLLKSKTEVRIKATYAGNIENVKLYAKVGNSKIYEVSEYEEVGDGVYYFYFDKINSQEFSKTIDFYFIKGNEIISNTLRFSVESYVSKTLKDETVGGVVGALMKYGKSALAYKKAE